MPVQKWICENCGASYDSADAAISCERRHNLGLEINSNNTSETTTVSKVRNYSSLGNKTISNPERNWGFHLNIIFNRNLKTYPSWATPYQRDKWCKRGVIIWDESILQVTHLQASEAIHVFTDLQDYGVERGITVGEPSLRFSLKDPKQKPQAVLASQIELNSARAQEFLEFLQQHTSLLQKMAEVDEKQSKLALSTACRLLIDYILENKVKILPANQNDANLNHLD